MNTLKIEMIHDVVCSWCPIGYANLKQALRNLNIKADFYFLPFELNPEMSEQGEDISQHLERRYGWSERKRKEYRKQLLSAADQAGVVMDFSKRAYYYNTQKAHQLLHWSEEVNKQELMNELLITAYFEHGLDVNNTQVLLDLIEKLGLDRSQAELVLDSSEAKQQLMLKKRRVQQSGITSVPAFIFNNRTLLTGSNTVEYFEQALTKLTQ